jgi:hypothetical protein
MPSIKIDMDPCTLHPDGIADEVDEYRVVMSHVHYGRGVPPSDDEIIANIVMSFRLARTGFGQVWLVWDEEDTGFGGEDSDMERIFDEPIEDDTHALLAWWTNYGFASGEDAEPLRRKIAELADVDYRHLEECQ